MLIYWILYTKLLSSLTVLSHYTHTCGQRPTVTAKEQVNPVSQTLWNKVFCSLIPTPQLSLSLFPIDSTGSWPGVEKSIWHCVIYLYLGWTLCKIHSCMNTHSKSSARVAHVREKWAFSLATFLCEPSSEQHHATSIECCWHVYSQSQLSVTPWSIL